MSDRLFSDEELKKVVDLAKDMDLKVWTSKGQGPISYVIIDDGVNFGIVESWGGEVRYSTCHQPDPIIGTGFGCGSASGADINLIEKTLQFAPNWVSMDDRSRVRKISFSQYRKSPLGSLLSYYEL